MNSLSEIKFGIEEDGSCPVASFILNEDGVFIVFSGEIQNQLFKPEKPGYYYDVIDSVEEIRMNGTSLENCQWENKNKSKCSLEVYSLNSNIYCIYIEKGLYFILNPV